MRGSAVLVEELREWCITSHTSMAHITCHRQAADAHLLLTHGTKKASNLTCISSGPCLQLLAQPMPTHRLTQKTSRITYLHQLQVLLLQLPAQPAHHIAQRRGATRASPAQLSAGKS